MAVYKADNGTYYFQASVTKDGKRKQVKRRGFKTKREATLAEMDEIRKIENQTGSADDGILFGNLCDEFLTWYHLRRKISSYKKVQGVIETHLRHRFGHKRISMIRPRHITQLQDELIGKHSINHVQKIHVVFSQVFNFAVKQEYTTYNPCKVAGNVEGKADKRIDYWTLEEFRRFYDVVDEPLYQAFFMLLYYSGMRKGEMLALTWRDIDADNHIINVDKTVYNRDVTTPKTEAAIRRIMVPKQVIRLLTQLKAQQPYAESDHVVFGDFYDHVSTTTLDRKFHKWTEEAGLHRIRLHDFRHSHASYLINRSTIISVIAARLGHADIAETLNTYSHLYPSTEQEAVAKMEDDFKSAAVINFKEVR
ncbi:site-specific integrase [Alkalicoccus luteus]|uniref:Site-specific integrase n=1 Tax=Alkalicoccus luteus TaxID=1237094 RepID=A0A969PQJ1_9BACI|nr:site-specific integrase [Alkalicoccus luteus]NJP37154.1 site-specific integrase [Alkalicoccus luteus]